MSVNVKDLYQNKKPAVSMEFSPPRDQKAAESFSDTVDSLSRLKPDYLSVTFGAGGSTREGSYQTVKQLIADKHLPTVAYIAGYGLGPDQIVSILDDYKALGVQTMYVIRGDQPKEKDFTAHPDSFAHASDIIAFIKKRYDFILGCAGYPEGHVEAQSLEKDIEYLKQKVDNGVNYVVTQYFYDNDYFLRFVDKCRAIGIDVPIIPGIMPVYTVKMTQMLSKICGSKIVPQLQRRLDGVDQADSQAVLQVGIDFAAEQCQGLLKEDVAGLHFYTMNRSYSTTEIIKRLKQDHLL
jgi:methylenetetrahydrofolate reductase (NADPH)